MIKKIDNYLVLTIVGSTLIVLFALLSIDLLASMISEIDMLGRHDYRFVHLLLFVLGGMPLKLALFFPMSLLIGALMGLGKYAANSELTVMQMAKISRLRIGVLGFLVALILGAIVLLITEFIGVPLNDKVNHMRSAALKEVTNNYGASGFWAQDGNQFVNVRGVAASGELINLRIFTLDDNMNIRQIQEAKKAQVGNGQWALYQVTTKTIYPDRVVLETAPQVRWENMLDNSVLELLLVEPDNLSIRDLYRYISYQKANGVRPTTYSLTFWQRLFIPLSTGVMFLLSLPFVFGSQRSSTQGRKLFIGVMLGLAYYVAYTSIANIILLTGVPVIWGAIIPIILFAIVSFSLLWVRG